MSEYHSPSQHHRYWQNPDDGHNSPSDYLRYRLRTAFLLTAMLPYLKPDDTILELGCNSGRNLHALSVLGFDNLFGVDINPQALAMGEKEYPALEERLAVSSIEDYMAGGVGADVIFTLATLQHIHPESERVFAQMAENAGRLIVTVEDERSVSWYHFPRDYGEIFGALGWRQVKRIRASKRYDLDGNFVARVFVRDHV